MYFWVFILMYIYLYLTAYITEPKLLSMFSEDLKIGFVIKKFFFNECHQIVVFNDANLEGGGTGVRSAAM